MVETRGHRLFQAKEDFRRARRQAALEEILARLTGQSAELLSFEDVKHKLRATGSAERGYQEIPLDAIVGSVGRYNDFTRRFLPRRTSDQERWAGVKVAMAESGLAPIEVYQIGDAYFVKDGNHRVSIALQLGNKTIPAYVTEIKTKAPLAAGMAPDDLIRQQEYADFLEQTELDRARPEASFETTEPGRYGLLLEQIRAHRHTLEQQRAQPVSLPEAAAAWYDEWYLPVVRAIRDQGILREFPDRTEADLYLWVYKHRERLEEALGWAVRPEAAAADLVEQESPQPDRVAARLGTKLKEALTLPALESGPQAGQWRRERVQARDEAALFPDVLVALSGEEVSWLALDQALVVAQREAGQLLGLHVVPTEPPANDPTIAAMQARFQARCQEAGVGGRLVVEAGTVASSVCGRARWADLITVTLSYPPPPQPLGRLKSGFRTLVRRCPRPLLVVPDQPTGLNSALLAYDGSPKAEEALYVATYLAGAWGIPLVVLTVLDRSATTEATLDQAHRYLQAQNVPATYELREGAIAPTILESARTHGSELLIMGGYSADSVREVVLGSAVDEVLRQVRRPMLICR